MSATEDRTLRIGEVAELVGITPRTIRYYEELGLLNAAPTRTKGAHRMYTQADVAQLQELIRLRDLLGLTLDELVTLAETEEARRALREQWHDDPTDLERIEILDQAIELAQRQLKLLQTRREKLEEFAAELDEKLRRLRRQRRELG
jgi:DNA-binding transcriptional MerR regulator